MGFSLSSTKNSITVKVDVVAGYSYYRIFCRQNVDGASSTHQNVTSSNTSFTCTFSGLSEDAEYIVHIYYSTNADTYSASRVDMGTQTIGTHTKYVAKIWNGSSWDSYEPYIWDGSSWVKYEPHIFW